MFSSNWTFFDLFRTVLDRTARGGVLEPQDDFPTIFDVDAELPYDRLAARLAVLDVELHDFRQHVRKKGGRGEAKGTRKLEKCTAICWHQMAVAIDNPRTCLGIPAHIAVIRRGDVVLLHPLRAYLYHGHAANRFSIGVEIACRAAGIEDEPRTFWRSRGDKEKGRAFDTLVREATDKQIAVALAVGDYIVEEIGRQAATERAAGARPPGIVAQMFHRNSHKSRTSDTGSRLALNVVKPLAVKHAHEFGGPVVGSGAPTPTAWGGPPRTRYSGGTRGY